MKDKLKGMLAVVLSAACILSVMPLTGFAAEETTTQTVTEVETTTASPESTVPETTVPEEVETTLPETDADTDVKEYGITYYLSDKEQYGNEKKFAEGETIVHPEEPKKEGFKFAGWILGEENGKAIPVPQKRPSNDLKAYASWEIMSYNISFTIDGVTTVKNALYGSNIS